MEKQDGYLAKDDGRIESKTKDFERRIIQLAINKNPLSKIFKENKIYFDVFSVSSGWSHKRSCPFPDHEDRSPSFYYNPDLDLFNCFGCGRSGKSVHFLSFLKRKSFIEIAEMLIEHDGYSDFSQISIETVNSKKDLEKELLEVGDKIGNFSLKESNAIFVFDCLIQNAILTHTIDKNLVKTVSELILTKI